MSIRPAEPKDLDALCAMAERFVGETDLSLTYSPEKTRNTLWQAIHSSPIMLVWEGEETIGGAVLGYLEDEFTNEISAYVSKFYVERELRGLGVARELLHAFSEEARRLGASVIFASATAGMGPRVEALYTRLFECEGYNVLGRVLVKELR